MLDEFIAYLQEQVKNGSIYVLGAQGQTGKEITEAWIKKREHNISANYKRAVALWKSRIAAGYDSLRAFDCSGLGMYWLIEQGIYDSDMNANGMKGKCTLISKSALKRGDWVFKVSGGRATHIGYVVDAELSVVESQGRAYGVVKRPLSAGGWNTYGRPACFAAEIDTPEERQEHMSFNRNLKKGCKGDDVRELQGLLNCAGDCLAADGDFGSKTQKAVKAYQKRKGLKADGIAGRATITALGCAWGADKPLTGEVTICSFNIKRGTYKSGTYKRIAEIVKGADIAGIQEVTPYGIGKIAAAAGKAFKMCETIKNYGHAVLTNAAVSSEAVTDLGGNGETRKVYHAVIGGISFYNTHFHYTSVTNTAQMEKLVKIVKADKAKVRVITGDFNRQEYDALTAAGFVQTNKGNAIRNTEGGGSIVNKIDQVFVSGAPVVDVWKYEAVAHKYSDHDALFVTILM